MLFRRGSVARYLSPGVKNSTGESSRTSAGPGAPGTAEPAAGAAAVAAITLPATDRSAPVTSSTRALAYGRGQVGLGIDDLLGPPLDRALGVPQHLLQLVHGGGGRAEGGRTGVELADERSRGSGKLFGPRARPRGVAEARVTERTSPAMPRPSPRMRSAAADSASGSPSGYGNPASSPTSRRYGRSVPRGTGRAPRCWNPGAARSELRPRRAGRRHLLPAAASTSKPGDRPAEHAARPGAGGRP